MQLDMFRPARAPAKQRPRTLHVIDAGERGAGLIARFACSCCGHETDWLKARSVGHERAGRVCPVCRGTPPATAGAAS